MGARKIYDSMTLHSDENLPPIGRKFVKNYFRVSQRQWQREENNVLMT